MSLVISLEIVCIEDRDPGFAAILAVALTFGLFWALYYFPQNSEWPCKSQNNTNQPNGSTYQTFICHLAQTKYLSDKTSATNGNRTENAFDSVKTSDIYQYYWRYQNDGADWALTHYEEHERGKKT